MAPKVGEKGPAKKGPAKKAADGKKKKKVSKAETYKIYIYSEQRSTFRGLSFAILSRTGARGPSLCRPRSRAPPPACC